MAMNDKERQAGLDEDIEFSQHGAFDEGDDFDEYDEDDYNEVIKTVIRWF